MTLNKKFYELLKSPESDKRIVQMGNLLHVEGDLNEVYHFYKGKPVLIDFKNSVFSQEFYKDENTNVIVNRVKWYHKYFLIFKSLVSPTYPATIDNLRHFKELLKKADSAYPKLLIVGGGSIGKGLNALIEDSNIEIISFDVYHSQNIDFIADAHSIPLIDSCIDGVIIQYVLEHVLEPEKVVSEIYRVLKPEGIVYAETPFLEQVHEGPYDFTRFTPSGHRFLFRNFKELNSGIIGGVGTHLLWTLEYTFRSIFRSKTIGKIVKLAFFWVRFVDYIIPEKFQIDAADSVFFLGRKTSEKFDLKSIINYYKGFDK